MRVHPALATPLILSVLAPLSARAEPPATESPGGEANAQTDPIPEPPEAYRAAGPTDVTPVADAAEAADDARPADEVAGPSVAGEACVASGYIDRGQRFFGAAHGPTAQSAVESALPVGPGEAGVSAAIASPLARTTAAAPAWRVDLAGGYSLGAGPVELSLGYALLAVDAGDGAAMEHEVAAEVALDLPVRPALGMAVLVAPTRAVYLYAGVEHEAALAPDLELGLGAGLGAAVGPGERFRANDASCQATLSWRFADPFVLSVSGLAALDAQPVEDEAQPEEGGVQPGEAVEGRDGFDWSERLTFVGAVALAFEL